MVETYYKHQEDWESNDVSTFVRNNMKKIPVATFKHGKEYVSLIILHQRWMGISIISEPDGV